MSSARTQASRPSRAESPDEHARAVREMFSAIAPRYDLLNHLLSLNIDRYWRRRAIDQLVPVSDAGGRFLDICTGTYDLALELAACHSFRGQVIAADFAPAMLRQGRRKIEGRPVRPLCGDALELPFPDQAFDAVMVGFGVRNLADIDRGLREFRRVLRTDGRLVVLDFATPRSQPLRGLYLFYFTRVLPLVGGWLSKHRYAYRYLPESVLRFPDPQALSERFERAGFVNVGWKRLTAGIACLWWGDCSGPAVEDGDPERSGSELLRQEAVEDRD